MTNLALQWHLTHNFYPSYDLRLIPYIQKAIKLAKEDKWDRIISIKGHKFQVANIIEDFKLTI